MTKNVSKILAVIFLLIIVIGITPVSVSATADELALQINNLPGDLLHAVASGNIVTVTGEKKDVSERLTLTINSDVTVNWEAEYSGTVAPASSSMITIGGNGTFNVTGLIRNDGTGNTLNITGTNTTVNIDNGGSVQSSRSGSALLISANYVTVNVNKESDTEGSIISLDGNANAAIQIGGGVATFGTKINVDGGSVISIGAGFAINDGAGTLLFNNNTIINVIGGVVTAGGNSAIHSTGIYSVANVSGGVVSNAAGNNLNPAIDMQGDMAGAASYNIDISGTAIVQSTSLSGYTLQSKGNIRVRENAYISAIKGRAINLVGMDSTARIEGGVVETSGDSQSSYAISTATTDPATVVRSAVEVTGGRVTSAYGHAINVTGVSSKVTVSGGIVSSLANNAINATGTGVAGVTITISGTAEVSSINGDAIRTSATNSAAVSVSGRAKVSSKDSHAIYASGSSAGVTVSGTCQIWVLNTSGHLLHTGEAIRCTNGTVTLSGGFVFAYGTDATNVIYTPSIANIIVPLPASAFVVAWNEALGTRLYLQGSSTSENTDLDVKHSGQHSNFWWYNHPTLGGGINYSFGTNTGFFSIPDVTIIRDYGLIFESSTGYMYENRNGTGIPEGPNIRTYVGYSSFPQQWTSSAGVLNLNGFSWNTSAQVALTIVGDTTIILNNDSRFESTNISGTGLRFGNDLTGNETITIAGNKTLTAVGRNPDGNGVDIYNGSLVINNGTFIAQAERAVNWVPPPTDRVVADPSVFDYSWIFSNNFDGSGGIPGYGADAPFVLSELHKYVQFKAVTPVNLVGAIQLGGISTVADSVAIELTFSGPVSGLTVDDITLTIGSGKADKGILGGSGNIWILTLSNVDTEGTVDIQIEKHIGDYYIDVNNKDGIEIYKAEPKLYNLILTNEVEDGADEDKYFEFEILLANDPRAPRVINLTTDVSDEEAFFVDDTFGVAPFPLDRIIGEENNILLLKHGEIATIRDLPIGFYYILEHQNKNFITAYKIDGEDWLTAPEGISRVFRLDDNIKVEAFNSSVKEEEGDPERPFDPDYPDDPDDIDIDSVSAFNMKLSKEVQLSSNLIQPFEFEILFTDDPDNKPHEPLALSSDPFDKDHYFVTNEDTSWLPPGRILGDDSSILLIKHGETVNMKNLPKGEYIIAENITGRYVAVFKVNDDDDDRWLPTINGVSNPFLHETISTVNYRNTFISSGGSGDPGGLDDLDEPDDPDEPGEPGSPEAPTDPGSHRDNPPAGSEKSPQTGDNRNFTLPVIMLAFSLITLAGAELYRKKSKRM